MTQPSHVCACYAAQEPPTMEQQEAAWQAYADARRLADSSGKLADGVHAVECWKAFVCLFTSEDRVHASI